MNEENKMIVCDRCLMAIESHEGSQYRKRYDGDETTCEWCEEEYEPEELNEIIF